MRHARLIFIVAALAAAVLSWTPPAFAQAAITGTIRGSVSDDSGNFLPGATVSVSSSALGGTPRTGITDHEGTFTINGLPVGVYSMTVALIGYQPYEMVQIIVNPDETRVFHVRLPEGLTEKVTVQAERP